MSMSPIVRVHQFHKQYNHIAITIDELIIDERVTLLVGNNGSGKSTIMKAMIGFIHYQGTIETPKQVSYMPEHTYFPYGITVSEFLSNLSQLNRNEHDYLSFLQDLNLLHKKDAYLHSLSKGMKAKVNLIQCLMKPSELYVLDEPLSGLDKDSIRYLIRFIKSSQSAFVISSHNQLAFGKVERKVIHLDQYANVIS